MIDANVIILTSEKICKKNEKQKRCASIDDINYPLVANFW